MARPIRTCWEKSTFRPTITKTGQDNGDNEAMYTGFDNDNHRVTHYVIPAPGVVNYYAPRQDIPGWHNSLCFGSAACRELQCRDFATVRYGRSTTRSIRRRTAAWVTARTAWR